MVQDMNEQLVAGASKENPAYRNGLALRLQEWSRNCLIDGLKMDKGEPTLQTLLREAFSMLLADGNKPTGNETNVEPTAYRIAHSDGKVFFFVTPASKSHALKQLRDDGIVDYTAEPLYPRAELKAFACPVTKTACVRNCSPERCAIAATT